MFGSKCSMYYCLGSEDVVLDASQRWPACNGRFDCDNKRDEQDCKLFEPERQVIASTTLVLGKEILVYFHCSHVVGSFKAFLTLRGDNMSNLQQFLKLH